ncbi:hypothetical protein F0562_003296 [Nyssa sinensis]|uniref:RING-type domain-containing protein n=1 Tax=Nyssa sinensis TaxID=561372 RepID=A0A5J5BYS9_9ASTE|nr:hypothetical protein F0562_003296 [Nyssa sinensis]
MAALSEVLSHLYTMTLVFFTILLLELAILVRAVARSVCDSGDRPINTDQFLKLIDEKNPAGRYKSGLSSEPKECVVCLSIFEEGDEIRKLKCEHTFHRDCLDTWLQQDQATCPLCRKTVLPEKILVQYRLRLNHLEYDGSDEELIFFLSAFYDVVSPNGEIL